MIFPGSFNNLSLLDISDRLFETLLGPQDVVISDQLNHASIIDGVRLCKAKRFRYANNDMNELESILIKTVRHRTRLITTDGIFSMDGFINIFKRLFSNNPKNSNEKSRRYNDYI